MSLFRFAVGLGALALLLAVGHRQPLDLPSVHTYVAAVPGSNAFVAVAHVEGEVMAYVCDGRDTATWLRGTATGHDLALSDGEVHLRARHHADGLAGTLQLGAVTYRFEAEPISAGGGFYRGTRTLAGLSYVGGWIVLRDGRQRGALWQAEHVLPSTLAIERGTPTGTLPGGAMVEAEPVEHVLATTNVLTVAQRSSRRPAPAKH